MKKYHMILNIFSIGLGLFVMILSYKLGLGKFRNPGPGLMPFLSGIMFLLISFYLLVKSLFKKGSNDGLVNNERSQINFRKLGLVLASLFAYPLFLEILGYLITTSVVLMIFFRTAGYKKWRSVIIASALTVLVTYFVFTFLGVRFPGGILKLG